MILTRRAATAGLAAGLILLALAATASRAEAPAPTVMHSGVFTWESLAPQPTKVGAVRRVFDTPTPTLSELEMHITTLKPGEALSFAELTAFLTDKIAAYKLPEFLELLEMLPRTPTGKAQKGPLRDIVLERMRARL